MAVENALKKISVILICFSMAIGLFGCNEKDIDYDQAIIEFKEYYEGNAGGGYMALIDNDHCYRYDLTGDGVEELIASYSFGSGMPRDTLMAYDPVKHEGYKLMGGTGWYSYYVASCDSDGLVVTKWAGDHSDIPVEGTLKIKKEKIQYLSPTEGGKEKTVKQYVLVFVENN